MKSGSIAAHQAARNIEDVTDAAESAPDHKKPAPQKEPKSPGELAISAETRLRSLKKRTNSALLELDDPNSERVRKLIAAERKKKLKAYEEQRSEIVGGLSEASKKFLGISSPEFLREGIQ